MSYDSTNHVSTLNVYTNKRITDGVGSGISD